MADAKQPNYTEEMTQHVVARYQEGETDEQREAILAELSEETGKTVKSLRAKLVREKVYVKKTYKTKTGGKAETKEEIVADIARTMGVDADSTLSGLEKATKNCLIFLRKTLLIAQSELLNEDN